MAIKTPFRYDHVGSFLRPEYLKQARAEFFDGKITREELTAVENKAITELVKKQKEFRKLSQDDVEDKPEEE